MTNQIKVIPAKIKLKKQKNDGEETDRNYNESFEKNTQSHAAPGITKDKGMHHNKNEVQVIEGSCEKKAVVGGEMDIEKPMEFNFL
jgi:hypothetical protein